MKKDDCIFCKIANGEIPSRSLYEDDEFKVIMDLAPATKGHSLILHKNHFDNLYELPDETAGKAMMLAKKNNIPLIFDIDYRSYTWKNKDEISVYYSMVARNADIILGSREEFDLTEAITGVCASDEESAKLWCSYGAKIVVIKHGKDGSTAYTNDGNSYTIKPFPVKMLKGFGGGDGYASSFIRALLDGCEIIDALEYGSASASMLISAHSCSEAMPSLEAVEKFIAEEKELYGEMVVRG